MRVSGRGRLLRFRDPGGTLCPPGDVPAAWGGGVGCCRARELPTQRKGRFITVPALLSAPRHCPSAPWVGVFRTRGAAPPTPFPHLLSENQKASASAPGRRDAAWLGGPWAPPGKWWQPRRCVGRGVAWSTGMSAVLADLLLSLGRPAPPCLSGFRDIGPSGSHSALCR
ncbi:uncharacterized protein LOC122419697 isoform X6 [Cervus canadensis]|uniref:uncharacterized protein LOC122419697 isoform X6 n=1 Tax=Cervus canadensis TaxID=1574408 RepID=UPI001C9E8BF3|nr:uncharacterized protein LOC122419697 isoform X6 [Cervus canadensis]